MARESATLVLRHSQTLHARGVVGSLADGQLLHRFVDGGGLDREDAFAALVGRHGPMVLKVCRRMLPTPADAEDAFQAVFLVLARRAGSLREAESLRSWLHGVAVRTAQEARRRAARRRSLEERATAARPLSYEPRDGGDAEILRVLDEEITRLPLRYREPILACELEGTSRQDAAIRLGLPEGTLSSRLARGRALLRHRLTRRGLAPGVVAGLAAGIPAAEAGITVPEALSAAAVRQGLVYASAGAASGTIPAGVASLTRGVLGILWASKLKHLAVVLGSIGVATCLAAGLAWAAGVGRIAVSNEAAISRPLPVVAAEEPSATRATIRGLVVDERGQPVPGAGVIAWAFTPLEARTTAGPDGRFTLRINRPTARGASLLARSADGERLGIHRISYEETPAADAPVRITMKPARRIAVRVAHAKQGLVPDVPVEAASTAEIYDRSSTNQEGLATLRIPADVRVEWIYAVKPGLGCDYAAFGSPGTRPNRGAATGELPEQVGLMLEGGRTARIKAVDSEGRPISGTEFVLWLLKKEGRSSEVNSFSRSFSATTGADGVATFDWLPVTKNLLQFWPTDDAYSQRRVVVKEEETQPVTTRLVRTEAIRGRVVHADGTPAAGIRIQAYGSGKTHDNGRGEALTGADGRYEMRVSPDEAYAVYIEDRDHAARSRLDVIVRRGKPAEAVDFTLTRGTLLRGTVSVGDGDKSAPGVYIRLDENGGRAPEEFRDADDKFTSHEVRHQFGTTTDAAGHYSIRIGPGTYTLMGPPRTKDEKLVVANETELVRDFRMPRPEKGPFAGRVVRADDLSKGVDGARVEIVAQSLSSYHPPLTADSEGRFRVERSLDPITICALSPDGSLGAIVERGAEDPGAVIAVSPTATASGLLLDEQGKPAAKQPLAWGRRVYLNPEKDTMSYHFVPKVVTDESGRFTLPSLVVGQEYRIAVMRENMFAMAGVVRPQKPGAMDLGTLQVGAYKPSPEEVAEAESSFEKDAPDAGAVAPAIEATTLDGEPLTLEQFKGKFVLLDFWATWCGPCIQEIPTLQAVHEDFGDDDRLAMVSLSVDEKIDEPRKFQLKRPLPWTQGFLGGGIHGPTPGRFGIRAIPAIVLVGPDGRIVARGMRGEAIKKTVADALTK
ncbi:MAG: sigma-70 family RNA polymerase sigma factor [Isosphaeraceae bacterium]